MNQTQQIVYVVDDDEIVLAQLSENLAELDVEVRLLRRLGVSESRSAGRTVLRCFGYACRRWMASSAGCIPK